MRSFSKGDYVEVADTLEILYEQCGIRRRKEDFKWMIPYEVRLHCDRCNKTIYDHSIVIGRKCFPCAKPYTKGAILWLERIRGEIINFIIKDNQIHIQDINLYFREEKVKRKG